MYLRYLKKIVRRIIHGGVYQSAIHAAVCWSGCFSCCRRARCPSELQPRCCLGSSNAASSDRTSRLICKRGRPMELSAFKEKGARVCIVMLPAGTTCRLQSPWILDEGWTKSTRWLPKKLAAVLIRICISSCLPRVSFGVWSIWLISTW